MIKRRSRAYRITLIASLLSIIVGATYLAVHARLKKKRDADLPNQAEQVYERGRQALDQGQAAQALDELRQANLLTDKALSIIDEELKKTKNAGKDQAAAWSARRGKLLWIKSLILRDAAYSQGLVDGKPLVEIEDSVTREKFRSVVQIPAPELRRDAIACLRLASDLQKGDAAIQQEALRTEMLSAVIDWPTVERLCRRLIEIDPAHTRARFLLAWLEFDQPQANGELTATAARDDRRIEAAREHLEWVRRGGDYPLWRVLYLQARILRSASDRPSTPPGESPLVERKKLRDLLFDPESGALARAARKEAFEPLTRFDVEGLIGLHMMAVDFMIEECRSSSKPPIVELIRVLDSFSSVAQQLTASGYGKQFIRALVAANMDAASRARRVLGKEPPASWAAERDQLEKLAGQAADAKVADGHAYAMLAQILNNDAYVEGRKADPAAKPELARRALQWIDRGLQLAEGNGQTADLVDLHGVALEVLTSCNEKAEALAPHLDKLRQLPDERATAIVELHEAAGWVREGKLRKAQANLDKVLRNPRAADMWPRALALLAGVALNTQQYEQALTALTQLERVSPHVEQLNSVERGWTIEFLRDPREVALLIIVAQLELSFQKVKRFRAERPGAPVDEDLERFHEDAALAYLKKLRKGTPTNQQARETFVAYYLQTGHFEKAAEMLRGLEADYPHSLDVLRLDVAYASSRERFGNENPEATARRQTEIEARIQAFMAAAGNDLPSRRFWAEWLVRSNRLDEALTYLRDPANFPGEVDEAGKRLIAAALFKKGEPQAGFRLLNDLRGDPVIETMLIRARQNPFAREQLLDEAISRHSAGGQTRVWEAERLLAEGKTYDAAIQFWQTREFSQVASVAQLGFLRAMLKLAQAQPDAALRLVETCGREAPGDAMICAIAAYAELQKGEIGWPSDRWEHRKSMCAALNLWQTQAVRGGLDESAIALFRGKFWQLANRGDQAWIELEPLTARPPVNPEVLEQLIRIALDESDDAKLAHASEHLASLKKAVRDRPSLQVLEARLLARLGKRREATDLLQALLEKKPDYLDAYPLLVMILNDGKQFDEAARWTERWLRQAPLDPVAQFEKIRQQVAAGQTEAAKQAVDAMLAQTGDRVRRRFAPVADGAGEKARDAQVKDALRAVQLGAAQAWQQAGKPDGAELFLAPLLDAPADVAARLLLAQTAMDRGDWSRARDIDEQILKAEPGNFIARTNLSWLLSVRLDRPAEALAVIRDGMTNSANHQPLAIEQLRPEFLDVLGQVYLRAARANVENDLLQVMVKIFDRATRRYPSDPRMHAHLADAHAALSEDEEAADAYATALRLAEGGRGRLSSSEREHFIAKIGNILKPKK